MNSVYLYNRTYRWLSIAATFVHVNATQFAPPPVAGLPEGSISVQVPSAQYRPQTSSFKPPQLPDQAIQPFRRLVYSKTYPYSIGGTKSVSPQIPNEAAPSTDLPEGSINLQIPIGQYRPQTSRYISAVLGADVIPIGLPEGSSSFQIPLGQYRPQRTSYRNGTPVPDVAPPPVDELIQTRRTVYLKTYPYVRPHIQTIRATEEMLPAADQCLVLFTEFRNNSFATVVRYQQLVNEGAIVEAPELHPSRRSVYLKTYPYFGKTVTIARQPTEIDELLQDKRSVYLGPPQPYRGKSVVITRQPTEIDELLVIRRSVYSKTYPYRGQNFFRQMQPPEPVVVEADELHNGIRSIYLPIRPYTGKTFTLARQPTEIDELIQQRRSVTLGPALKYSGPVAIVLPQIANPLIVEYDERLQSRVVIMRGVLPYNGRTTATFKQPDDIASDELLPSRRSITLGNLPYRGKTLALFRQPTEIDELLQRRLWPLLKSSLYRAGYAFSRAPWIPNPEPLPEGKQANLVKVLYPKYDPRLGRTSGNVLFFSIPGLSQVLPQINNPGVISNTPERGVLSSSEERGVLSRSPRRGVKKTT